MFVENPLFSRAQKILGFRNDKKHPLLTEEFHLQAGMLNKKIDARAKLVKPKMFKLARFDREHMRPSITPFRQAQKTSHPIQIKTCFPLDLRAGIAELADKIRIRIKSQDSCDTNPLVFDSAVLVSPYECLLTWHVRHPRPLRGQVNRAVTARYGGTSSCGTNKKSEQEIFA